MHPDPTTRFSNRVNDYLRYRPRYPEGLVSLIARETGLDESWNVADIGSGTGFSAIPFLENGNKVFGVEPNAAMREAATALLATYQGFISVEGRAEATALESDSVDMVIAGQAFHWFDRTAAASEFKRILRRPQWVVLFWNARRTSSTPFLEAYEHLLLRHGTDYDKVRHDNIRGEEIDAFFGVPAVSSQLEYAQDVDFDSLRGRLLSSSYVPPQGDPACDAMLDDLAEIFTRHSRNGYVRIEYDTMIFLATLPG